MQFKVASCNGSRICQCGHSKTMGQLVIRVVVRGVLSNQAEGVIERIFVTEAPTDHLV